MIPSVRTRILTDAPPYARNEGHGRTGIPKHSLLESDIEITPLLANASREGFRKKPVYEMHKWWARRLSSTFRFLLLASFADETASQESVWDDFYGSPSLENQVVLDPFMGGGTTVVEAAKLGLKILAADIDPVAWFVVSKEVSKFNEQGFLAEYRRLEELLKSDLQQSYQTRVDHSSAEVIHFFWVDALKCPYCKHRFEGHINYLFYDDRRGYGIGPARLAFCRECHEPRALSRRQSVFECLECGTETDAKTGPVQKGIVTCPSCLCEWAIKDIPKEQLPIPRKLFAVEYVDPKDGTRRFKPASSYDLRLFQKAQVELQNKGAHLPIPDTRIPTRGRNDRRPLRFGLTKYSDLFNSRQLLSLGKILNGILECKDMETREFMLLAFSDSLAGNNWFCSYAFGYRKLTPLFGIHAFRYVGRPVEGNVWGSSFGRGSFSSCVRKVLRGKRYSGRPWELRYDDGTRIRVYGGASGQVPVVPDFASLMKLDGPGALLRVGDSGNLSWIPARSVDLILTDPPYYDNLAYSELSDFYYAWLRKPVDWPQKTITDHTPMTRSLFVRRDFASADHYRYARGMNRAFAECRRVLKPSGMMVFTFHHSSRTAWEVIGAGLKSGGLRVTNSFPLLSEGSSGFHSEIGNIKWDVVFVCRPAETLRSSGVPRRNKASTDKLVSLWVSRAKGCGIPIGESDKMSMSLGFGTALEGGFIPGLTHRQSK